MRTSVTLLVSHELSGWLKRRLPLNKPCIVTTLEVFHLEMSSLKLEQSPLHVLDPHQLAQSSHDRSVTLETSQELTCPYFTRAPASSLHHMLRATRRCSRDENAIARHTSVAHGSRSLVLHCSVWCRHGAELP